MAFFALGRGEAGCPYTLPGVFGGAHGGGSLGAGKCFAMISMAFCGLPYEKLPDALLMLTTMQRDIEPASGSHCAKLVYHT